MKKRNARGFTLVEMLTAVLILTIMGVGLTTGIASAVQVYHGSVFSSESQLLSDTMDTALADVLRYAKYEEAETADTPLRFSNANYRVVRGSLLAYEGRLKMNPTDAAVGGGESLMNLLSDSAYSSMDFTDLTLSYDVQTHVFSGSYTLESKRGSALKKTVTFAYRTLVG
ncbi:MAG: prepilin-type N-terminal cleavage/methylation domain-containing protein [Ruthenibacterium sp.]